MEFFWKKVAPGSCAAAALLLGGALAQEAKMYAITSWNSDCSANSLSLWDDLLDDWYNEITNDGFSLFGWCWWGHCSEAYSKDGRRVNGNMVNSLFADSSVVSWGNDTPNLDDGDAVMIATHGFDSSNNWGSVMRVNESGSGDCSLLATEMEIGDSDLEFLHLSSCNSMDDNMWGNWIGHMTRAHQVDGFHGFMWIGSGFIDNYGRFADDAFDSAISAAWLDNHYVPDVRPGDDQCPVAYAIGTTRDNVLNRLHNERYDNVYGDPPSNANWWAATYIVGCDPAGENRIAG